MLSALVSKTKAFVGLNENQNDQTEIKPNIIVPYKEHSTIANNNDETNAVIQGNVYDCIRTIQDPEKPATLEDLEVVYESGVKRGGLSVKVTGGRGSGSHVVDIEFNPTVPHCSLATLIGLCMRVKVERCLTDKIKLDIHIKQGAHDTEDDINKQINDKERVAAAMENPSLKEMVEKCIKEEDS